MLDAYSVTGVRLPEHRVRVGTVAGVSVLLPFPPVLQIVVKGIDMQLLKNLWKNEPAGCVTALQALIALVVAFGLSLTVGQVGAIVTAVTVVGGLLTRSQVSSVAALKEFAAGMPPEKKPDAGYSTLLTVLIIVGIILGIVLILVNVDFSTK